MAKPNFNKVLESPADFLYIFATDDFLAQLGKKAQKIITGKRKNQMYLIRNVYANGNNTDYNNYVAQLRQAMIDTYGKTPAEILVALANGEAVAGKNWREGVFGVGKTNSVFFTQNKSYVVDSSTGKMWDDDAQDFVGQATAIYNKKGDITGYSTLINGDTYTTRRASDGKYYANTFGSKEAAQYWDGSEFKNSNAANIWEGICTYLPTILNWITSILSYFGITYIPYTQANTLPAQADGWIDDNSNASGVGLFAGIALLIYGIFNK